MKSKKEVFLLILQIQNFIISFILLIQKSIVFINFEKIIIHYSIKFYVKFR
jgi:hypothetical protein